MTTEVRIPGSSRAADGCRRPPRDSAAAASLRWAVSPVQRVAWAGRLAAAAVLVVAFGCKGGPTKSPEDCMRKCDEEECQYRAGGLGDDSAYFECLEGCEQRCGG